MKEPILYHVAEYIRLSREDGDKAESDSVGNQRKLIADFLAGQPEFTLHDSYIDDGWTGTNFRRPAFIRMLDDIEAGNVNCVIVKDLSRFGRDYIDAGKYLERYFPDHDIRFISITDNIDSKKQAYDMLLPIKNIFNEQYARDISRKIHASVRTKQKAGEFIGAFASYGYRKSPADKNKLLVDNYAAAVVRRIFQMYISGLGKVRIAGILNEQGIVCPSEYKKLSGDNYRNSRKLESTTYWTYSTVNRLLQNEMYIGNMVQGRKTQRMRSRQQTTARENWIVVKDTHEPIIDIDTWNKVQDLLKRRTRNLDLDQNVGTFAGFLKCGDCGKSMVKKAGNFYCGAYVRSGRQYCSAHAIPYTVLESIVLDDLRTIIRSIDHLPEIICDCKDTASNPGLYDETMISRLQAELNRVRKLKKTVYEDYREELISREDYLEYRKDYLQKEAFLAGQLTEAEQENAAADCDTVPPPWIRNLLETGEITALDRDIIIELLQEIRVFSDHKIRIIYHLTDGS